MVQKREAYAPWSLTRKAGVQSATVNGDIEVPQFIQPTLNTGFVDEKGDWKGLKSSDEQFILFQKDEAIGNTGEILYPNESFDMTGFSSLFLAIRVTNGGNFAFEARYPADGSFANITPLNPKAIEGTAIGGTSIGPLFQESAEASAGSDVWNIYKITQSLAEQKRMQFLITNNSGGIATMEMALMRLV